MFTLSFEYTQGGKRYQAWVLHSMTGNGLAALGICYSVAIFENPMPSLGVTKFEFAYDSILIEVHYSCTVSY